MSQQILAAYKKYLNPNYAGFLERLGLDCTVEKAEGSLIRDSRGDEFIDFLAGYGIFNLGHNPPEIIAALRSEFDGLPMWNRPFLSEPLAQLASKLVEITPAELDRVFICSTGAEAVDSAVKLARLSTGRAEIIAAEGGFHGFTLGALSVSGIAQQSHPFKPLLPEVRHVPFGDAKALLDAVSDKTAAVLLEPVQAEIGAVSPPAGYLSAAREICDRSGALLLIDEARTGMGRTGPLFAIEHESIAPDVLILGKSLAGGIVPIGAIIAHSKIWRRFGLSFAMSASSFAGNRLACVAALATLKVFTEQEVLKKGKSVGQALWNRLSKLAAEYSKLVSGVSGKGLLAGIHFHDHRIANEVVLRSIRKGLLIGIAFCQRRCILLEPAITIPPSELHQGMSLFCEVLETIEKQ